MPPTPLQSCVYPPGTSLSGVDTRTHVAALSLPAPSLPSSPHNTPVPKHKHKRSVASKKKRDPNYIPRPPNKFILFRMYFLKNHLHKSYTGHRKGISRIVGDAWNALPVAEKEKWAQRAYEARIEHAKKYPNWKYRPVRKSGKQQHNKQAQDPENLADVETPHENTRDFTSPADILPGESPQLRDQDNSFQCSVQTREPLSMDKSLTFSTEFPHHQSSLPAALDGEASQELPTSNFNDAHTVLPYSTSSYSEIMPGFTPTDFSLAPPYMPAIYGSSEHSIRPPVTESFASNFSPYSSSRFSPHQ